MGIEHFKRWHWMMLGALLGLALGYAWTGFGGASVEGMKSGNFQHFEQEIMLKDEKSGEPFIRNIIIHPEQESVTGKVNIVTYERLATDKEGRIGWIPKKLTAKVPYKPAVYGNVADPNMTFEKFLDQLAQQNNSIKYKSAWWMVPRNGMILGCLAGIVAIGGIWPTMLNVMVGAGLGRKYEPKEVERERSQWYGKGHKSEPAPTKPRVTAEDEQRMRELTAAYEKGLAGAGVSMSGGAMAGAAAHDGLVRKLEGGQLETTAPMKRPGDDDDIEVKGEYYPVLIHHQKKKGDDAKDSHDQTPPPDQKK